MRHNSRIRRLTESGARIGAKSVILNKVEDYGIHPHLVTIGNYCIVTSGVKFITNPAATRYNYDAGDERFQRNCPSGITIHDNCFLGMDAVIFPGVSIGPNSIVGAGAIVMDNVPENSCAFGNPCRVSCNAEMYKMISKKSVISNYSIENKRAVLAGHFWKRNETV